MRIKTSNDAIIKLIARSIASQLKELSLVQIVAL